MPSDFVTEQIAALKAAYGEPVIDAPLSVSDVSQEFATSSPSGMRANHALGAARNSRTRETWHFDPDKPESGSYVIGLSDIDKTRPPCTVLTVTFVPDAATPDSPHVASAWRLPRLGDDVTPTTALLELIESSGLRISFGATTGLFIASAYSDSQDFRLAGDASVDELRMAATIQYVKDQDRWRIAWAFAIDEAKYRAALG